MSDMSHQPGEFDIHVSLEANATDSSMFRSGEFLLCCHDYSKRVLSQHLANALGVLHSCLLALDYVTTIQLLETRIIIKSNSYGSTFRS